MRLDGVDRMTVDRSVVLMMGVIVIVIVMIVFVGVLDAIEMLVNVEVVRFGMFFHRLPFARQASRDAFRRCVADDSLASHLC